jgi:hypothetical protein
MMHPIKDIAIILLFLLIIAESFLVFKLAIKQASGEHDYGHVLETI